MLLTFESFLFASEVNRWAVAHGIRSWIIRPGCVDGAISRIDRVLLKSVVISSSYRAFAMRAHWGITDWKFFFAAIETLINSWSINISWSFALWSSRFLLFRRNFAWGNSCGCLFRPGFAISGSNLPHAFNRPYDFLSIYHIFTFNLFPHLSRSVVSLLSSAPCNNSVILSFQARIHPTWHCFVGLIKLQKTVQLRF